MKKHVFVFQIVGILMLLLSLNAFADEDPAVLFRRADSEIFVKKPFVQNYWEKQGYVNEFITDDILHQYFIYNDYCTDILMSLHPAEITQRVTNKRIKFDDHRAKVFHQSFEIQRANTIPENGGWCYIRYSNSVITGVGRDSGVIVYPGLAAYSYTHQDGEKIINKIANLSNMNVDKKIRVDIIRIDGISYFYFDKQFNFKYEDGISDIVAFEGGSELSEGGNRIECRFDNFSFATP